MLSVTAYSQWEVGDYVDGNGVETGEIFLHQTSVGTFSKGKKKNKSCNFFLEHDLSEQLFVISVFPYGKEQEDGWKHDTFQWLIIKQPSGELRSIEALCYEGQMVFEGAEYDEFMKVIKDEGSYIATMSYLQDSTKTYYKFRFNN